MFCGDTSPLPPNKNNHSMWIDLFSFGPTWFLLLKGGG